MKPTVGPTYEQNGFVYRSIRTETHVFVHTVKGLLFSIRVDRRASLSNRNLFGQPTD